MGFFGSGDKLQSTVNTQIGVSDDGLYGGGAAANNGATALSFGGKNAQVGNTTIKKNKGTIIFGQTAEQVAGQVDANAKAISDLIAKQTTAANQILAESLSGLTELAETKATGGESQTNKTVLYVILAGVALLAWIFWRK